MVQSAGIHFTCSALVPAGALQVFHYESLGITRAVYKKLAD